MVIVLLDVIIDTSTPFKTHSSIGVRRGFWGPIRPRISVGSFILGKVWQNLNWWVGIYTV